MRQRTSQELIDGVWRPIAGESDITRTERQQDLLLGLLSRLREFRSPTGLADLAADAADTFILDDGFSLAEAVDEAWNLRRLSITQIFRPVIPVDGRVSDSGEFVRVASQSFQELLLGVYPKILAANPIA